MVLLLRQYAPLTIIRRLKFSITDVTCVHARRVSSNQRRLFPSNNDVRSSAAACSKTTTNKCHPLSFSPLPERQPQQRQRQRQRLSTSAPRASSHKPLFDKVLIANRGEIACRVIRTCHRLNIPTVAVYSEADGGRSNKDNRSLHAQMADESHEIGTGPSPGESYLRGEEVLEIAKKSGARAIHPGYGFLSENANFANMTMNSSLTFIGPPPDAILAMGSKSHSKALMMEAGVPVTPGYHGSNQEPEHLLHEAVTNVGFPLLIKATMGGGGKGMRLVWREDDFLPSLDSCKRESRAAFGDDSVILERYLVNPRHVEVQVVADTHGNVLHLHERDCSLQRRHQKIIEEAPAPDLTESVRKQMGDMAKRAALAVGYVNAGTVEFLVDTRSPTGEFYFCEMNTRLQVEHPITELITGVDLVEWQLRIAAGEELPITNQDDVPRSGHAMEARIYAENPARDFLPATGEVWHHDPPVMPNVGVSDGGIRVDTGIKAGDEISVYYDPMISKLIVHGPDRDAAVRKLISSLKKYQIAGVPTNIPFLIKCAGHPTFNIGGAVHTGFLDDHADDVKILPHRFDRRTALARAVAAFAVLLHTENRVGIVTDIDTARRRAGSPWSNLMGSWRMGGDGARFKRILIPCDHEEDAGTDDAIECLSNRDGSFDIRVPFSNSGDDAEHGVEEFNIAGFIDCNQTMRVTVDKTKTMSFTVVENENIDSGSMRVHIWSEQESGRDVEYAWEMSFRHPRYATSSTDGGGSASSLGGRVKAPMPGKVIRVNASEGKTVKKGDVLFVMEAMKMEHTIRAPADGIVAELDCAVGEIVNDGTVLAVVHAGEQQDEKSERSRTG